MASSYQTLSNVYDDVRGLAGKDSTTLTDGTLLRLANKYYMKINRALMSISEDLYGEISYTDLVANQDEYPLPEDSTSSAYSGGAIKLQRVEVSYDGANWYVVKPISYDEVRGPSVLVVDKNSQFGKSTPKYYVMDRSLFIIPVPESGDDVGASSANLYIWWIKRPDEMTSSADIPESPKDFLDVLAEGILSDVFRTFGRLTEARDARNNFKIGLEEMKSQEQGLMENQPIRFQALPKRYD